MASCTLNYSWTLSEPVQQSDACLLQPSWLGQNEDSYSWAQLTASILSAYTEDSEVEEIWTTWKDGLIERVQQYIPHRTTELKRDLPWVDYELKKLTRRRYRIHKKWKKTGREELYTAFRALKTSATQTLQKLEHAVSCACAASSGRSLRLIISQLRMKHSSSNCRNHVRRSKSSVKDRIIVRRTVRSMFGEQTVCPVKKGLNVTRL